MARVVWCRPYVSLLFFVFELCYELLCIPRRWSTAGSWKMRLARKGLLWCWIVSYVAMLADCHVQSVPGVVTVNNTRIKVTSVLLLEGTDENLQQDITGYMEKAVEELGKVLLKREDESEVQKPRNEAFHLVTENMSEGEEKLRSLWRKSAKKRDEHILLLVDFYATNPLTEVEKKAALIVGALKEFQTRFETNDLVREMVGVYPEEGMHDIDGIGVAVGVYVTQFEIPLGAFDVEEQWIKFEQKSKKCDCKTMSEEANQMFNHVRKVGREGASESIREMMKSVGSSELNPVLLQQVSWQHGNLEVMYRMYNNADVLIIGPLRHYFMYILNTLCYAIMDVQCEDDNVLAVATEFCEFRVVRVLR